ncbi:hypothetical protein ES705_49670 [subsurface metagenome]
MILIRLSPSALNAVISTDNLSLKKYWLILVSYCIIRSGSRVLFAGAHMNNSRIVGLLKPLDTDPLIMVLAVAL